MKNFLKNNSGLVFISLIFWTSFLLILPLRDISLADDFAYIQTVQKLVQTGTLKVSEWAGASILFQIFWGSLFSKIFGFSIKTLIFSNVVLFYFATLAFYKTLKTVKIKELNSIIFTLFLLSFPWVFGFAYSFMSDVFYMSLSLIAVYFYSKAFTQKTYLYYILGSLFAGLAFINRQIGISIVIGLLFLFIYKLISEKKINLKEILCAFGPALIFIAGYYLWISRVGMPFAQYAFFTLPLKEETFKYVFPSTIKYISVTNKYHTEYLIQRGVGYFSVIAVPLIPLLLVFKFNLKRIIKIIMGNLKLVVVVSLIFALFLKVDFDLKQRFINLPNMILGRDKLLFVWNVWWKKIFYFFTPVWIVIFAIMVKKVIHTFFEKRKPLRKIYSRILLLILLISFGFLFYKFERVLFPYEFYFVPKPTYPIIGVGMAIKKAFSFPTIVETFRETWLVLLIIVSITFMLYKLIVDIRIKFPRKINLPIFFVILLFIFHYVITVFFAYGFWDEYAISFVPFVLIGLSYFFKDVKMSVARVVIFTTLSLLLIVGATRNRVQLEGTKWETANKLIENGVDPIRISDPTWSWQPYWFFENSFAQEVKNSGGDKYKLGRDKLGIYRTNIPPGDYYNLEEVPVGSGKLSNPNIVYSSEPFWIFNRSQGLFEYLQIVAVKTTHE